MKKIFNIFTLLAIVLFSACSNDDIAGNTGYLTIDVSAVTNTNTRAIPSDYNPRQLAVKIIDANNKVVQSIDDYTKWQGKKLQLLAGTYTIVASSNGWDGNDSGRNTPYYTGSATATVTASTNSNVEIVCTQANVKVSVEFDANMKNAFTFAIVTIKSAVVGVEDQSFDMGADEKPAYFPVGNMVAELTVVNKQGASHTMETPIENVKARDHYILKYSTAATGSGQITITADDAETEFTYNFTVPTQASTVLKVDNANAWSNFAYLQGTIPTSVKPIVDDNVKMKYKKVADTNWTEVATTKSGNNYKATARNLSPATDYVFKMVYTDDDDTFESQESSFTTETAISLPNANLDDWCTGTFPNGRTGPFPISKEYWNANGGSFWGTSNAGTSTVGKSVTTQETSDVHTPGGSAARLESQKVSIAFAAASLYAGDFADFDGASGVLDFGKPFTSRPTQFKGWYKYSTGAIDNVKNGWLTSVKGEMDTWSCYVALMTEGFTFRNKTVDAITSTMPDFKNDPRVIAYGEMPKDACGAQSTWKQFTVDLKYHDLSTKPSVIVIVISSSRYGDYFAGYNGATLLVDDLELVYGEPVQE